MGRRKIEVKRNEDKSTWQVTFSKGREGLAKKDRHTSILCDADIARIIFSSCGNLYEFCNVTKSGKSSRSNARGWLPKASSHPHVMEFAASLTVPIDFGCTGAILITNLLGKEFYVVDIVLHGFKQGPVIFPANTWIHSQKDNRDSRIIFKNQAYLPSKRPEGLKDLRREDLLCVRGNGKGERKPHERIYDYALYNDLGNPEKSEELARPVLGVPSRPYPRRCRTGRPPMKSDPLSETRIEKPHPVYVPRDETFEEIKQNTF